MKTLIIGYGNNSRTDDGVGWFVIEQLARFNLPGVKLEAAHQLEIELAEALTHYDRVIFVDATVPEALAAIQRSVITPHFHSHAVAHYLSPADVLALSSTLYGHEPEAILFSIRGKDFNFGLTLSPSVVAAAGEVVSQIARLVQSREVATHA